MGNNELCSGNSIPQNNPIENRPPVENIVGPDVNRIQDMNPPSSSAQLAGLMSNPVLRIASPASQQNVVNYPVQALKMPESRFLTEHIHGQPRSAMRNENTHVHNVLSQRFTIGKRPNLGNISECNVKKPRNSDPPMLDLVDLVANPFVARMNETVNQPGRNSNPLPQLVDLVTDATVARINQCVNEPDMMRAHNSNPPPVVDLVTNPTFARLNELVNQSKQMLENLKQPNRPAKQVIAPNIPLPNYVPQPDWERMPVQQNNPVRNHPIFENVQDRRHLENAIHSLQSTSAANAGNQPNPISQSVRNNDQTLPQPGTSRNKYCVDIYQKLRGIFPDIDKEYIKRFCPPEWSPGINQEIQLSGIVETVFQHENSWIINPEANNTAIENVEDDITVVPNVDDTYDYLTNVFPNADPHFLRKAAENFKNEHDITAFVDDKLKNNNYPTREQSLTAMKVTEEQQRYTSHFSVENFLTLFPDPFKHFEDPSRKCAYSLTVVEFLKVIFNKVRVLTINKTYRMCNYNMSLTAMNLRNVTDFICTPRRSHEIPTNNISLLQEMAFVRHQDKILERILLTKQEEEDEFYAAKAAGGLWSCQCCYDEECMPSKCSKCENGHIFCNSCIINGTNSKLGDGETHIPCFLDCGSEFSIATLQKVLPPTKLCILLKKRQADEVMAAGLEGLVFCPFCHFASIPPEGDKVFKCFDPECMKESCILCKEPNHVPYKCGELQDKEDKARKYIEEKMTQALTRTCYKCKKVFFKEEGCNKMTCTCGAIMCYICGQPVPAAVGYKHFRGQGSDEVDKCPLWTDNARLNAETVRKVEEEARKEILKQDPNIQIKTTELAPALPQPRPGPHTAIAEHTQNIADAVAARVLKNDRFGH